MKILYLGVFEKPYDTEVFIANSLEALGHTVIRVPMTRTTLYQAQVAVLESQPDFILFSKGWFHTNNEGFVEYFKNCGFTTVGWFFDLAWGTKREHQIHTHMAFRADIVCTTDGGHDEQFKLAGINHHTLRQGVYEPEAYMAEPGKAEDIVFVGSVNAHTNFFNWPYRQQLLDWTKENYESFGWYGQEDGLRNHDLNKLFASAKIVLGDSVYSKNYWSNRLYETIGRGGFLIFPEVEGIEKEFTPYKHFIPYRIGDWQGLRDKIDYYLAHDEERKAIQKAGFEYCKANHTYKKRCERLIEIVNEHKLHSAQQRARGVYVGTDPRNAVLPEA